MRTPLNLGFLASHRGSNMQAVIDACKSGYLDARPRVVISNNEDSGALHIAQGEAIPCYCLNSRIHPPTELDAAIRDSLIRHEVELVILAGYMRKLGPATLAHYRARIINIHPALLPKYGGQGMYGMRVHEAVLAAGEDMTGVTIHLVDANYDTGPILAQCPVQVMPGDTPESLAARVLEREHGFLVETLRNILAGKIALPPA